MMTHTTMVSMVLKLCNAHNNCCCSNTMNFYTTITDTTGEPSDDSHEPTFNSEGILTSPPKFEGKTKVLQYPVLAMVYLGRFKKCCKQSMLKLQGLTCCRTFVPPLTKYRIIRNFCKICKLKKLKDS